MFEPLGSKHSTSQRSSPVPSNGSAGPYCQHTARPTQEAANTVLAFSLVIPAYNESQRLPPYLETIRSYLSEIHADQYEVIVVDDGSSDHLGDVLAEAFPAWEQIRVLRHPQNMGKGAAVRTGVVAARGSRFLFADADGATPIEETQKLCAALDAGADLAVGSRLLSTDQVTRQRTWRRGADRSHICHAGWLAHVGSSPRHAVRIQNVPQRAGETAV